MVRSAEFSDVASLTAIYNDVIQEGGLTGDLKPLSVDERRFWLAEHKPPYAVFVKLLGSSIAGYAAISPYRKGRSAFSATCELSYYFAKSHRGRGLGTELVGHAIRAASDLNFKLIAAAILSCNLASINLLKKFDFSIVGSLPDAAKVNGIYIDHIFLARKLPLGSLEVGMQIDNVMGG